MDGITVLKLIIVSPCVMEYGFDGILVGHPWQVGKVQGSLCPVESKLWLKTSTAVAALSDSWHYRVSVRTGWQGVWYSEWMG